MNDNENNLDVIVVDDDADIGLMIKSILTYHKYKVTACTSADQMLTLLNNTMPSLIIMDMLLSGTDGREVCKTLKGAENTKTIPILMISAHPNARETCLAAGADDFLEKPFDMDALLGRSKYLMNLN